MPSTQAMPPLDLVPAYPEIFLLAAACAILVIDLFLSDRQRHVTYMMTQLALLGTALLTVGTFNGGDGQALFTFSDMYVADRLAVVLKLFVFISAAVCLVYSRQYLADRGLVKGEYYTLTLFATLGMMVMISANHFLIIYIGLELMSLCLYALVALNRDSARSTEAAMKYFVLGALASGLLLYGLSMLYGATGSLDIGKVSQTLQAGGGNRDVLVFGLVFVVAGLAFKLGVVPFHMWVPDVYDGAPSAVTLFVASAPKVAAFAMTVRLLVNGLFPLAAQWQDMLFLLAVLSLVIGNVVAIAQTNIKRMLAYSTISHMGFVLLGLAAGVVEGNIGGTRDAYSAAMFYVAVYALMALGAFGMLLLLSRAGFEAENIDDLKGLNARHPWYALMMLLIMFSLVGIPPTVGFYAKLAVLQALVQSSHVTLAVVAVLFSLIGAFYYLRVVKVMYFDEPTDRAIIDAPFDMRLVLSANGLAMLGLGLMPTTLMNLCVAAVEALVI
jgi:NADH-quinone oxidoreductase subunit N